MVINYDCCKVWIKDGLEIVLLWRSKIGFGSCKKSVANAIKILVGVAIIWYWSLDNAKMALMNLELDGSKVDPGFKIIGLKLFNFLQSKIYGGLDLNSDCMTNWLIEPN